MARGNPKLIKTLSSEEASFDLKFFKRFWKICGFMFPSFKKPGTWLALFLLLLCLLEQVVIYYLGLIPSKFYKLLNEKDESTFLPTLIKGVLLILAEAFILSTKTYTASVLYITWRASICKALHDLYFTNILYYKLNVVEKTIDNPDQRMTQDVERMCDTFSKVLVPIIITPFTTGYYLYQAFEASGYIGPVSTVVFFTVFTVFNKLLMTPVVKYFYLQEKKEGDFRYKHMQIRMNAESAAFFQAGDLEKDKTNHKLANLLSTQHKLIRREYALNLCINTADYLGSILSYIAISVPIFSGRYDHLSSADLSSLISKNGFVCIYLINCFTKLIDQSAQMTDVAGAAHRIGQLFEELGRLKAEQNENYSNFYPSLNDNTNANGDGSSQTSGTQSTDFNSDQPSPQTHTAFKFKDVSYGLPNRAKVLCKNLTFQLTSGTNVIITGDSGCGKTSLLRVLSGLWKYAGGDIKKEVPLGPRGMFYLPQKPYFTDGSLREQIIYPMDKKEVTRDDGEIERLLQLVDLDSLLDRLGGFDVDTNFNWYDELSPGEMQRLSFVRLFFHQPPFAVLDEATSQVSQEMEELLYSTCSEMGITFLSIGHRSTVRKFHDLELHLSGGGRWYMSPLDTKPINDSDL